MNHIDVLILIVTFTLVENKLNLIIAIVAVVAIIRFFIFAD